MQRFSLYRVHKVLARTHGTTAALLYPHSNALRGDKKLISAAILLKISQINLKVICIQKNTKKNLIWSKLP